MPNESLVAKVNILERSIQDDQNAVAIQWAKTFKYNAKDNVATNMAKLMLACLAQGEFKTKSTLIEGNQLTAPSSALTAVDYLSHASRIIVDYSLLSEKSLSEFLSFFPQGGEKGVITRSATHGVMRKKDQIVELKGFLLGVTGQLPSLIRTPSDFGINIAMGGEGQVNLIGKKITDNGFSGHLYFNHSKADKLLMFGLEQSAPATSVLEALWGHHSSSPDVQSDSDQFGQGHSLTGASDVYTAAGSLYFSDSVYQAKLLAETGTIAPDKYGAMQLTLTEENWPHIKEYLLTLQKNIDDKRDDLVFKQLIVRPKKASEGPPKITSFFALDFNAYLKSIRLILEQCVEPHRVAVIEKQQGLQEQLLICIQAIQSGKKSIENVKKFHEILEAIHAVEATPIPYKNAIARIQILFKKQLAIDPTLNQTHVEILVEKRCNELMEVIYTLQEKAQIIQKYFSSDHISQENGVGEYLGALFEHTTKLERIRRLLNNETDPRIEHNDEKRQESKDEKRQECKEEERPDLTDSWQEISNLTLEELSTHHDSIHRTEQFLNSTPKLVSESLFKKTQAVNRELELRVDALKLNANQLEAHFSKLVNELRLSLQETKSHLVDFESTKEALILSKRDTELLRSEIRDNRRASEQTILLLKQSIENTAQSNIQVVAELQLQIELESARHIKEEKRLQLELSKVSTKESQLHEALETQEADLQLKKTKITQLEMQLHEADIQNHRLTTEVKQSKELLSHEKQIVLRVLEELRVEKNIAQQSITAQAKQIELLVSEKLQLNQDVQKLKMDIGGLTLQLDSLRRDLLNINREAKEQSTGFEVTKSKLLEVQSDIMSLQIRSKKELEQAALKVSQLEQQISLNDQIHKDKLVLLDKELTQEKTLLQQAKKKFQNRFTVLEDQKQKLVEALALSEESLDNYKRQNIGMQRKLNDLTQLNAELERQVQQLKTKPQDKDELLIELEIIRKQSSEHQQTISANEEAYALQLNRVQRENKLLQDRIDSLTSQLLEKTKQLQETHAQLKSVAEQSTEMELSLKSTSEEQLQTISELEKRNALQLERAQGENILLQRQIDSLTSQLLEITAQLQDTQAQLKRDKSLDASPENSAETLLSLKSTIDGLREAASVQLGTVTNLTTRNRELEEELALTKATVRSHTSDLSARGSESLPEAPDSTEQSRKLKKEVQSALLNLRREAVKDDEKLIKDIEQSFSDIESETDINKLTTIKKKVEQLTVITMAVNTIVTTLKAGDFLFKTGENKAKSIEKAMCATPIEDRLKLVDLAPNKNSKQAGVEYPACSSLIDALSTQRAIIFKSSEATSFTMFKQKMKSTQINVPAPTCK